MALVQASALCWDESHQELLLAARIPVLIRGGRDVSGKLKMHSSNSYPHSWETWSLTHMVFWTTALCALFSHLYVMHVHLNLRKLQVQGSQDAPTFFRGATERMEEACCRIGFYHMLLQEEVNWRRTSQMKPGNKWTIPDTQPTGIPHRLTCISVTVGERKSSSLT